MVHRRGGAARHRRALHDAGQPGRGRPGGVARLPRSAQEAPPAAPDQRRAGGGERRRPDAADRDRDRRPRARDPAAPRGAAQGARDPLSGLSVVHQVRSGRGLRGVLRRPGPGRPGPGLGLHLPGRDAGGPRPGPRDLPGRVPGAGAAPRRAGHRAPAGRAGRRAPRAGVRVSPAVLLAAPGDRAFHGRGLPVEPVRDPDDAARGLLHERDPGGHPGRPPDGHARPDLRSGPGGRGPLLRDRPELLPHPLLPRPGVP